MNQINIHIGRDFADETEVNVEMETTEPAPEPKKLGHFEFNIPQGIRVNGWRIRDDE
jgi:hypothetical protein